MVSHSFRRRPARASIVRRALCLYLRPLPHGQGSFIGRTPLWAGSRSTDRESRPPDLVVGPTSYLTHRSGASELAGSLLRVNRTAYSPPAYCGVLVAVRAPIPAVARDFGWVNVRLLRSQAKSEEDANRKSSGNHVQRH